MCLKWDAEAIISDTVFASTAVDVFPVLILKNFRGNTFERMLKLSSNSKIVTYKAVQRWSRKFP